MPGADGAAHLQMFSFVVFFFHFSEFALAWLYMREELGWHSWLVSKPYCIAMTAALVEYGIERTFTPQLKQQMWPLWLGLAMVIAGEVIRKTAMVTARSAFTHQIKHQRRPDHYLITHGIYRYCRHPGYFGWMLWAIGTQVLLANPLSVIMFSVVVQRFFQRRIAAEEQLLRRFFGLQYEQYASVTPTWMPGIP